MRITNNAGLDLAVAVWLAEDEYIKDPRPNHISVTGMIKPIKQIILARRVPEELQIPDLLDRVSSGMGHVLHRGIEHSWLYNYASSMKKLGIPQRVIDAVRINPEQEEPDTIPVYTEHREEREIDGHIVSGQVDLIIEGRLRDAKSTKVWGYVNQKGVEQWKLQGSIYRWLNPEKIKHDELVIQYLLLDWSRAAVGRDPSYPPHPVPTRSLQLMGLGETEKWVKNRLALLAELVDAPEELLPECSEEELWRTEPKYKYYANPAATGRSTKNFEGPSAASDAQMYMSSKGGKGRIDYVPGEVKACNYCPAFPVCKQKDRYILDGSLQALPKREP